MNHREQSPAAKYLASLERFSRNDTSPLLSDPINDVEMRSAVALDAPQFNESLYSKLRRKLDTIRIDEEDLYVVEGDTLLDEAQLEIYSFHKEAVNKARVFEAISDLAGMGKVTLSDEGDRGLLGITQGGKTVRWKPDLALSYCILKNTFTSNPHHYELVKRNFKQATEAWESTCGIKFEYKPDLDFSEKTDPSEVGVIFVVRELDAGGSFIAAAFFPNDPVYRRRVLIDPSYYEPGGFDKVGVLRHELGHVLGFRHEHIRSEAPITCNNEDLDDVVSLTEYDSKSVMHYLCGGLGDPNLRITDLDRVGAQRVYGPPLNAISFIS